MKKFSVLKNATARLFLAVLQVLSLFSLPTLQRLGAGLGRLARYYRPAWRVSCVNIQLCFPEKTAAQCEQLAALSLQHTGMAVCEYAMHWFWSMPALMQTVNPPSHEALQRFESARASGRGLILLVPHLGAFESMLGYLPQLGRATLMYRPLKAAALENTVRAARERAGAVLVPATAGGIKRLLQALQQGEIVVVLPDQVPAASGGVLAPFFGEPAWTMTLAWKLARRTGARAVVGFVTRLPNHQGFMPDCIDVPESFYGEDEALAAGAMNQALEAVIRRYPEQYIWSYKRFKKRPKSFKPCY